jgi:hypothetical protein
LPVTKDGNCTKLNRRYAFPQGLGRSGDLRSGFIYRSSGGVEAAIRRTNDPYGTTYYSDSGASNYFVNEVTYIGNSSAFGCTCTGLPGDVTCTLDVNNDGGSYATCPSATSTGAIFKTGPAMPGGNAQTCKNDYSNQQGPNCDNGTITFRRILCQSDFTSTPANCTLQSTHTVNCGGEVPASCKMGGTAPDYLSVYLADTHSSIGTSPFSAIVPDFKCSGQDCLNNWKINPGSGSGSGSGMYGSRQDLQNLAGEVFGLPEGKKPWNTLERGLTGSVIEWLNGDGIGGILYKQGYTTCETIPTSGTLAISVDEGDGVFTGTLYFGLGDRPYPAFAASAPGTFAKKITLEGTGNNETMEMEFQYNCPADGDQLVGYLRTGSDETRNGSLEKSRREIYYDATTPSSAKLESIAYAERPSLIFRRLLRMDKQSSTNYYIWNSDLSRITGSGSGSGSGSLSWQGSNMVVSGNVNDAKYFRQNVFQSGDMTVPVFSNMALGGVMIMGGPAMNGTTFNFNPVDIGSISISPVGNSYDITYDDNSSGTLPQHNSAEITSAINSYFGGSLTATDTVGSAPFSTVGTFYMTGGRMPNNILSVNATGSIYDITVSGVNSSSVLSTGKTFETNPSGERFSILNSNGCCTNYFAVADTISNGDFRFKSGTNLLGSGMSITNATLDTSLVQCSIYNGSGGGCTAGGLPGNSPVDPMFYPNFNPDSLFFLDLSDFPGP